jgi:hypothetical protein
MGVLGGVFIRLLRKHRNGLEIERIGAKVYRYVQAARIFDRAPHTAATPHESRDFCGKHLPNDSHRLWQKNDAGKENDRAIVKKIHAHVHKFCGQNRATQRDCGDAIRHSQPQNLVVTAKGGLYIVGGDAMMTLRQK